MYQGSFFWLNFAKYIVFHTGKDMAAKGFHIINTLGGNGISGGDEIICLLQKFQCYTVRRNSSHKFWLLGELSHEFLQSLNLCFIVNLLSKG